MPLGIKLRVWGDSARCNDEGALSTPRFREPSNYKHVSTHALAPGRHPSKTTS